jgi:hypothetical protein
MSIQLFTNPDARGSTVLTLRMHELYEIIHERLEYVDGDFDPDAVCQNICCEIEKKMGIYPNIPSELIPHG